MKKILIVSTVPSSTGLGGVTVHTQRILESEELNNDKKIAISLFDYKKHGTLKYIKALFKHRTIHLHLSNPKARLVYSLLARVTGRKLLATFHGRIGQHSAFNNFLDKISIFLATVPITINDGSYAKAKAINKKAVLMPAFIPPQREEPLPQYIDTSLMSLRGRCGVVFATNASSRSFDVNGNEIYGIEKLVEYFNGNADKGLVISDPSNQYGPLFRRDNVLIISGKHSFYEVLKRSDAMIRNTCTDGDALSVKEALCLGKPVLATDVVSRPEGVVLFRYNDMDSLNRSISKIDWKSAGSVPRGGVSSAIPALKNLYESV